MDVLGNVSGRQHQFQGIMVFKGKDMVYLNHMSLSENAAKYVFNQVLNPPTPTPQIPNLFPFLLFNCLLSMSEKQLVR